MELLDLVLLAAMLMTISFVLGATVMWGFEVRGRNVQPLWFVIARHLMALLVTAYVFFRPGALGGNAIIDATWSAGMGAFALVANLVVFAAELRHRHQHRQA